MGMFDTVFVQSSVPLPSSLPLDVGAEFLADVTANGLQTKDMECLLDVYTVNSDGTLSRHSRSWGQDDRRSGELVDFHGRLKCHTLFVPKSHPGLSFFVTYVFKFTDGILSKVEDVQAQDLSGVYRADLKSVQEPFDSKDAENDLGSGPFYGQ